MPTPKPDDPLLCPASDNASLHNAWEYRKGIYEMWWICPCCKRALKRMGAAHRVRSKTTRSLDRTRDILANLTRAEIESAPAKAHPSGKGIVLAFPSHRSEHAG